MNNAVVHPPVPQNEPVYSYAPGTPERQALKKKIQELKSTEVEIPVIIGGEEIYTGRTSEIRPPHELKHRLGLFHKAGAPEVEKAIKVALEAQKEWAKMHWEDRFAIFLKAAELLSQKWRYTMNAATMLGQSKNPYQAEIDAACELTDFLRFNVHYARRIYEDQPYSPPGFWNQMQYRPLEGFIFAVPPFNFTSIEGNLPTAPAIMGNVAIWKPAPDATYSAYFFYKILEEAGLPPCVISFLPGDGPDVGDPVLASEHFSGLHFTGSIPTFEHLWRTIGENISKYRYFPRVVGETGGKDFIVAHPSADIDALVTAVIRGAFEYQGQKCSAVSRVYFPESRWPKIREKLLAELETIKIGPVEDFTNFMNAVINKKQFDKIVSYIEHARQAPEAEIIYGGKYSDEEGYYIEPTLILVSDPYYRSMREEIFGPVLSIYIYKDNAYRETLELVDKSTIYGLTGSIFAQDRYAIIEAIDVLEQAAGNFYINDKPTGAIVNQQPFGGARKSGTNDKAGSYLNLLRWVSARATKETFHPPTDYCYPFMEPDVE